MIPVQPGGREAETGASRWDDASVRGDQGLAVIQSLQTPLQVSCLWQAAHIDY